MGISDFFNELFASKDSESYSTAKSHIVGIKNKLSEMIVVFPDVTISEMVFMKNRWEALPTKLGKGVSVLGLDIHSDYKLLITKFSPEGFLEPHEHNSNFEMNKVINGEVYDSINNKLYKAGDVFVFDKDTQHNLSTTEGAVLLTVFSMTSDKLIIPENIEEKISHFC